MSGIFGLGNYSINRDYSDLFSNSISSGSTGSTFDYSEYARIKNGSYRQLVKAYYKKQQKEVSDSQEQQEDRQQTMETNSSADALKTAAQALESRSLWEKKDTVKTDAATGEKKTSSDYDWDSITKAVKTFVNAYNKVVEDAGDSGNKSVLRNAAWMTGATRADAKVLSGVGITVQSNNKLSLDEDKLKAADVSELKSLFVGVHSYGDQISQKAGNIRRLTTTNKTVGTYTSSGTYNNTITQLQPGHSTTEQKKTYAISDAMKKDILEDVKNEYYYYGGKYYESAVSKKSYDKKTDAYVKTLDEKNQSAAKWTIDQLRTELSDEVARKIKASNPNWSAGTSVSFTTLDDVFSDRNLLKNAEAKVYNGSVNMQG